jgi:UDP-N-acetylglucosamine 2-epimerase (non-hydrolysing)
MKLLYVVGARPNFMKVDPIMRAVGLHSPGYRQVLVHTGQHYDPLMSEVFFEQLELPEPDINLEVGSGSHAWQTAQIMLRFEPVLMDIQPDWLLVVGDVNSTLACSLVASKLGIKVAHVEAGLRSFDRKMPEEINRLLTDQLADLLFTPSEDGTQNLLREGVAPEKIRFVGNVMLDTLVRLLPKSEDRWTGLRARLGLNHFILVTLHRPSNVDDRHTLAGIMDALVEVSQVRQVLFPVHPRTRQRIAEFGLGQVAASIELLEPLGYLDFLALEAHADLVLTDSGGIQEETTFLGIPCLTARQNTERPVTIRLGTNRLVGSSCSALVAAIHSRLDEGKGEARLPPLWDGRTAQRIVDVLESY